MGSPVGAACRRRSGGCRRGTRELAHGPDEEVGVALDEVAGRHVERSRPAGPATTWSRVRPRLSRAALSTSTRISRSSMAKTRAEATPSIRSRRGATSSSMSFFSFMGGHVAGDAPEDDRELAEAELDDQGSPASAGRYCLVEADLVADVLGGEIEVGPPLELDLTAETPSEVVEVTFLTRLTELTTCSRGLVMVVLDVLGRGPRVGRDDGDRRELEVGEEVEPQPGERDGAQDDQDERPSWTS